MKEQFLVTESAFKKGSEDPSASQDPATERQAWVDYAKGICMIGVVSLYATDLINNEYGVKGWLQYWVDFARPFRIPDFFVLSGLFMHKVIDRPWNRVIDSRVFHYLYFYILWTVITYLGVQLLLAYQIMPTTLHRANESLTQWLWEPFGLFWFIHILPVFFLVTRLTRRIPVWIMVLLAATLQTFPIWNHWGIIGNFCERYVYFYIGYAFGIYFMSVAQWALKNIPKAFLLVLGWSIINSTLVYFHHADSKGISLILGIKGSAAVILTGAMFSKVRYMSWLSYLGRNSLVTYLGFFLPVACLVSLLRSFRVLPDIGSAAFLISAFGIYLPQLLHMCTKRSWASFLFERPSWARYVTR